MRKFEDGLRSYVRTRHDDLLEHTRTTGDLPDGARLDAAIAGFKDTFESSEG